MTATTPAQLFSTAMQQHQDGNLAAAEQLYRQVLGLVPNHPDSIHMLGVLAMQTGKLELALDLIDRSIRLAPKQAGFLVNRANVLTNLSRIDDAILAYQQALALDSGLVEAKFNLGNLLKRQGQLPMAAACYEAVANARPDVPGFWTAFAVTLDQLGEVAPAADAWQRVCELQPDDPDALNNRGNALQQLNRIDDAIECYQRALAVRPDYPEGHNNLANAYLGGERLDQAIDEFRVAITQHPDYAEAHRGLGNALKRAGRLDESIAAHEQSVRLQSDSPQALSDLGCTLHAAAKFDEAIVRFRSAIQMNPEFPDAHFNLGLSLLIRGQFEDGWKEHEWRWRIARHRPAQLEFPMPQWEGEPIEGKRLLLLAEQGFGDTIMAARYVARVAERGARITLICPPELKRLLANLPGVESLHDDTNIPTPIDAHVQSHLMSLPRIFGTTSETIPSTVPYLKADPDLVGSYRSRVEAGGDRMKVGLVWNGRPKPDPGRSVPLSALAPLTQINNAAFFNLQLGPAAADAPPPGLHLTDITTGVSDFADTAALIENLDLIITIDTATAHLAGALGKPTYVLLPWLADWRWMIDRDDSPWYPTMRLFRQTTRGDWADPVARLVAAVQKR